MIIICFEFGKVIVYVFLGIFEIVEDCLLEDGGEKMLCFFVVKF